MSVGQPNDVITATTFFLFWQRRREVLGFHQPEHPNRADEDGAEARCVPGGAKYQSSTFAHAHHSRTYL